MTQSMYLILFLTGGGAIIGHPTLVFFGSMQRVLGILKKLQHLDIYQHDTMGAD